MLLHRSASILHFHKLSPPHQLLAQFNLSRSSLFRPFSSSSSRQSLPLWLIGPRHSRARSSASFAAAAVATRNGGETFYAEEGVSWKSLGVSDKLSRALSDAGIERPSLVQVLLRLFNSCPFKLVSLSLSAWVEPMLIWNVLVLNLGLKRTVHTFREGRDNCCGNW